MDVGIRQAPHAGMGFRAFVGVVAALMATNALGVDAMLPALGKIGAALGLGGNERQWVVSSYLIGFGAAHIFYGTLADRFGRKPVIYWALGIYIVASLGAACAGSFEGLLVARVVEGVGAAGTRVLAVSIVRDCYAGRRMARVMSLSLLVFLGVPVLAPSLGQAIMLVLPWRWIFVFLAGFGAAVLGAVAWRLPETLNPADRRPVEVSGILQAARAILSNRASVGYTLALSLVVGGMFGFINAAQQVFTEVFHRAGLFALIFAMIAGGIAAASVVNARLVDRLGSRLIAHTAMLAFLVVAAVHVAVAVSGHETVWRFAGLQVCMMFCFGLMIGNFGAMAMEPLGHIAGSAAAMQGFFSTLLAALIGFGIGQAFNGTVVPLVVGFLGCGVVAVGVVVWVEGGRLFGVGDVTD